MAGKIIDIPVGSINSEERLPIVLLLDRSGSMAVNDNIGAAVAAVNSYIREVQADRSFSMLVDIAVVAFNARVDVVRDWAPATDVAQIEPGSIVADGNTNMEAALGKAIEMTRERARRAKHMGSNVKVPIVVLVSDFHGIVSDKTVGEIRERDEQDKLNVWCYAVSGADTQVLNRVCNGKRLLESRNGDDYLGINQFFELMVAVSKTVSQSAPGERPRMEASPLDSPDNNLVVPDVNSWL